MLERFAKKVDQHTFFHSGSVNHFILIRKKISIQIGPPNECAASSECVAAFIESVMRIVEVMPIQFSIFNPAKSKVATFLYFVCEIFIFCCSPLKKVSFEKFSYFWTLRHTFYLQICSKVLCKRREKRKDIRKIDELNLKNHITFICMWGIRFPIQMSSDYFFWIFLWIFFNIISLLYQWNILGLFWSLGGSDFFLIFLENKSTTQVFWQEEILS